MNALSVVPSSAITVQSDSVRNALRNSFYPGASDASIDMVISYCQAGGFDPMTKPVHIVPMWDNNAKSMRDTIMPGIGLYRIIADRTGKYAGQDDAEFGPKMEKWGIIFPEWCKVTLYKITPAGRVPYSAKVFWLESYSTKARDTEVPNAMWKKRPFGQLEKCAEAAALRKAFPEVGAQPTVEEMDGKSIEPIIEVESVASPVHASRTEALKAKINESLVKSGAMPAIIPDEPPAPPIDMDPQTGEVVGDPIAGLLLRLSEAQSDDDLEQFRPAMAGLKAGEDKALYRRALDAWKAAKARIGGG